MPGAKKIFKNVFFLNILLMDEHNVNKPFVALKNN